MFNVESFKKSTGEIDVEGLLGYSKAIQQLFAHLAKETQFNRNKRMVDVLPIIEAVEEICPQINYLLSGEKETLKDKMAMSQPYIYTEKPTKKSIH